MAEKISTVSWRHDKKTIKFDAEVELEFNAKSGSLDVWMWRNPTKQSSGHLYNVRLTQINHNGFADCGLIDNDILRLLRWQEEPIPNLAVLFE